tara:strand:- start:393 stop:527 length:135 start_codon:yes stop_codon:yes gene_type:complete
MIETIYIIPLIFYGIGMFCLSIAGYYTAMLIHRIKDLIKHYKDE